jgi:Trk K+ transport system NAD-binding subunit
MRTPLILLICAYAISVTGFVLIPGMDDQGQPWKMGFFHAFYFVSFMGSTIGFGEIPYPFTDAQRLWTLFTIYATVISWLYAIGTLIALLQTPLFRAAVTRNSFRRKVDRIKQPFYIICGYGDTGSLMVDALTHHGIYCVVIDKNPDRINSLDLEDLPVDVPRLQGDGSDSDTLTRAGLKSAYCKGVVAVVRSDEINLKVAIASKLLNPDAKVFCWAETHDTGANMASFGTDHIINPYDTFADYLSSALTSPSTYLLHQWLSSSRNMPLCEPVFPPKGRWLLCGYGKFGKAVYKRLLAHGLPVTVIENRPDLTNPPANSIVGRGTEAETLEAAEIHKAVGVIAGTDHDVNNLSILITAKDLNPGLFTIARQERSSNTDIFSAANIDLVTNHSSLIASQLLAQMTTPLTAVFLDRAGSQDDEWARVLISKLSGCVDGRNPLSWVISLNYQRAAAFTELFNKGENIYLHHLMREPTDRKKKLPCVALLLQRDGKEILLPDDKTLVYPHDRILFAGDIRAKWKINDIVISPDVLYYTVSGSHAPTSLFWRWVTRVCR